MKKVLSILAGISILLTGCGNVQEVNSSSMVDSIQPEETVQQAEIPVEELPETNTPDELTSQLEETSEEITEQVQETMQIVLPESQVQPETETQVEPKETQETIHVSLPESEPQTEPVPQKPDKGVVVNGYISAIQDKIAVAKQFSAGSGDFSVTYALYDMDKDGVPELLLQYGTCEADYQIAIYTIRNNALTMIADNLGGGHTSFAYDYVANQLVLAWGHMGYGDMTWYDLDENGKLRELINTGGFQFAGDGLPEYEDVMKKYNVAWLDGADSFSFGGEVKTYLYTYSGNEYNSQEYDGLDFRYLQNYPFG